MAAWWCQLCFCSALVLFCKRAGQHQSCEVASEFSRDNLSATAPSGPRSHPLGLREERPSISSTDSYARRTLSAHAAATMDSHLEAQVEKCAAVEPATSSMAKSTKSSIQRMETLESESSDHDEILRDLESYASIGNEARAHIHQQVAAAELYSLSAEPHQPEACNASPTADAASVAPQHRYPASLNSSAAWPDDSNGSNSVDSTSDYEQQASFPMVAVFEPSTSAANRKSCGLVSTSNAQAQEEEESNEPTETSLHAAHGTEPELASGVPLIYR